MCRTCTTVAPTPRQAFSNAAIFPSAFGLFLGPAAGLAMPFCMSMMRSVGKGVFIACWLERRSLKFEMSPSVNERPSVIHVRMQEIEVRGTMHE
ncbi:hypothetical protein GCM10011488_45990 [Steroidobacter agaridevorans]|nr:hypothetical protein GCM10011488_45990 [Steroidobacter agaridevorans]